VLDQMLGPGSRVCSRVLVGRDQLFAVERREASHGVVVALEGWMVPVRLVRRGGHAAAWRDAVLQELFHRVGHVGPWQGALN
jgi:hypothetical protein